MKRVIFVLFIAFLYLHNLNAQTYKYYSTDFAIKAKNEYGYWSDWSDWEPCKCLVIINFERNVINIYSKEPQEFDIYEDVGEEKDREGSSFSLKCVDKDGLRCSVRFRMQNNGVLQLYVEYNDIMYVYCLIKRN